MVSVHPNARRRGGFTLVEVMTALMIVAMMMGGILAVISMSVRQSLAGSSQLRFLGQARKAEQRITRYIQLHKYFEIADTNTAHLYAPDHRLSLLQFVDGDNDLTTVEDNRLVYTTVDGEAITVCQAVTPLLDGTPIFRRLAQSPDAIQVSFHVGDRMGLNQPENVFGTGPGYQGVEVRFAVTPRNKQKWYTR